jgi:hypothetical protein
MSEDSEGEPDKVDKGKTYKMAPGKSFGEFDFGAGAGAGEGSGAGGIDATNAEEGAGGAVTANASVASTAAADASATTTTGTAAVASSGTTAGTGNEAPQATASNAKTIMGQAGAISPFDRATIPLESYEPITGIYWKPVLSGRIQFGQSLALRILNIHLRIGSLDTKIPTMIVLYT